MIICANSISEQTLKTTIKIGHKIDSVQGYIANPISSLNSAVEFFVKVSGGNGYSLTLDLNDGNNVTVNWPQLKDKSNGMFLKASYSKGGKFFPTVTVSNAFGSVQIKFCSFVTILPESTGGLETVQSSDACTFSSNLALFKNSKVKFF